MIPVALYVYLIPVLRLSRTIYPYSVFKRRYSKKNAHIYVYIMYYIHIYVCIYIQIYTHMYTLLMQRISIIAPQNDLLFAIDGVSVGIQMLPINSGGNE